MTNNYTKAIAEKKGQMEAIVCALDALENRKLWYASQDADTGEWILDSDSLENEAYYTALGDLQQTLLKMLK